MYEALKSFPPQTQASPENLRLLDDISKPQVLARKFKTRIRSLTDLKRRLGRRLIQFRALKSSGKTEISSKKL